MEARSMSEDQLQYSQLKSKLDDLNSLDGKSEIEELRRELDLAFNTILVLIDIIRQERKENEIAIRIMNRTAFLYHKDL